MRIQRNRTALIALFLFLSGTSLLVAQSDWELAKQGNGVQVYPRQVEGSSLKEFRASMYIDATVTIEKNHNDGSVTASMIAVPTFGPVQSGRVRVQRLRGFWRFAPQNSGRDPHPFNFCPAQTGRPLRARIFLLPLVFGAAPCASFCGCESFTILSKSQAHAGPSMPDSSGRRCGRNPAFAFVRPRSEHCLR